MAYLEVLGKGQGALTRPGGREGGYRRPENREQSVQARSAKPSTATENGARDKRATGEATVQAALAAVL